MEELSNDARTSLKEMRRYGFSIRATSEILGIDRETVKQNEPDDAKSYDAPGDYAPKEWESIKEALPEGVTPSDVVESQFLPDDEVESSTPTEGQDPFKTKTDEQLEVTDDPENTTPGEFIDQFFTELEAGVKSKFIRLQARRADRKDELPDEEKMRADLEQMPSGTTGRTAEYVAEEYWEAAKNYIAETPTNVFRGGDTSNGSGRSDTGDFVSVNDNQQQQGGWIQMPDGSRQYGRMEPDGQGGMRFVPMQPPQQGAGGPQRGQQPQASPEVRALREEMREMRREMNGGGGGSFREQIQEMKEMQSALRELQAEGEQGADEAMSVLRQELRALRSELQGGGGRTDASNPREAVVQRMLANEQLDEGTIMDALDRLEGQTDPEVREMEIEREMEQKKMEQKKERQDKILGAIEDITETATTAFAESLRGGDESDDQTTGNPPATADGGAPAAPPQQAGQAGGQQYTDWECPACGTVTQQSTSVPGRRCGECDFSRVPCPDCRSPVDIPPASEREENGCPECNQPIPIPEDMEGKVSCLHCDWFGEADVAMGEVVECSNCGSENPVQPDPAGA
jgi:hypothetical protein